MDVFPTDASFFRTAEYWGRFYSNPKLKDFDWYGTLDDFLESFNRSLSSKVPYDASAGFTHIPGDCIIINVGCGNSVLPFKLYELGYRSLYNLDFCPAVLDEMRLKDKNGSMHWVDIDVSNESYEKFGHDIATKFHGHPKVIIDKAFFDAYISIGENESQTITRDRARRYINSTLSFMSGDDVFVVFSLAQDYVVAELVRNLLFKDLYVDIYPLYSSNSTKAHMIQFLFAIYKKPAGSNTLKSSTRKQCLMVEMPHLPLEEFELGALPKRVRTAKGAVFLGANMHEYSAGRRVTFDIYPTDFNREVCFAAAVYDCVSCENAPIPTAAIIVPTAQEHLWQYACSEGNEELACQAGARRVIVLWLKFSSSDKGTSIPGEPRSNMGFVNPFDACFGDDVLLRYIQDNMSDILLSLSLSGTRRVTILKAGDSCAVRAPRRVGSSVYAGDIVVQEVLHPSDSELVPGYEVLTRQMVFSCSPQNVQSEVRYYLDDNGIEVYLEGRLPNEYVTAMLLSMAFIPSGEGILAVMGSGSGNLPRLLRRVFVNNPVHAIEIDDAVMHIARSHFGYSPDAVVNIEGGKLSPVPGDDVGLLHVSGDALDYVDCVLEYKVSSIFIDINNVLDATDDSVVDLDIQGKNSLMSPHPKLLGPSWLAKVATLLKRTHGMLAINVLTRSSKVLEAVLSRLSSVFAWVGVITMPSDINKVVVCLDHEPLDASARFEAYVSSTLRVDNSTQASTLAENSAIGLYAPHAWCSESLSVFSQS